MHINETKTSCFRTIPKDFPQFWFSLIRLNVQHWPSFNVVADVFNEYKMSLDHLIWWWWRWCWWWFYGDEDDDFDYDDDDDDDFDDGPVLNWHVFSMNANRVWIHREIERSESWNLILSIMGSTYLNTNIWNIIERQLSIWNLIFGAEWGSGWFG